MHLSRARVGERRLLDALVPLGDGTGLLQRALERLALNDERRVTAGPD
jgi:hypothetical protein